MGFSIPTLLSFGAIKALPYSLYKLMLEVEAEAEALYLMKRNNYLVYYIKMELTKGAPSLL